MTSYLARRVLIVLATLLAASLVVFLVLQVLPGDPAALMLGTGARADTLAALRHQLGLDAPLWLRYLRWIGGLLAGRFGTSYTYSVPVRELIAERVMVSLPLAVIAIVVSTAIAIPVGVLAAARRGLAADAGMMGVAQIGVAVPNFWLGLLLILPALALALPQGAILARVTRAAVIETLGEDFVRTARAKGLTQSAALWRHAVPNALVPVVTLIGLQFSFLLAGTVIIENVFTLPGLGRLVFQAIAQRDLIVVQDLVVLLAGSVILVNFLVDLVAAWIDPRQRLAAA